MTVSALMLAGLPPFGLGIFARDTIERGPWRFVAVNAWRSDAAEQVSQARARGAAAWLYGTPERFRPDTWRDGIARLARMAGQLDVSGVIVDSEGEWPELAAGPRNAEARALGAAMADLADATRVGFTSYPSFQALPAIAEGSRGRVFGVVQIYGRTAMDAETFATWLDAWRAHFGRRVIPAIAGWPARPSMRTDEGFRAYLAALPRAPGAIVWDAAGESTASILDALAEYQPGGSTLGTVSQSALVLATHPQTLAALAVVAVVVLALIFGKR